MTKSRRTTLVALGLFAAAAWAPMPRYAGAQVAKPAQPPGRASDSDSAQMAGMADHAMSAMATSAMAAMDENMMKHMELTPERVPTHADSMRAQLVADELKRAIAKYQDTATAVADGYKMFLPNVKNQRVYHFTNYKHGFRAAFMFDPAQPTSLLYQRSASGALVLIGAMYTAPKGASLSRLDDRVPLSIARWHKHVNWCLPKTGQASRWTEQRDGKPVFGPESPIATKAACDAVDGRFYPSLLGWMIHANVIAGHDLASIWGDNHHDHVSQ